ncbi:bifunctional metallophosphatase/5'-nucleotidase [Opitutia bacterium ISCC 51]|nr:bifunctional metallophosphatase/5'-nucleotidase [Opitutae bacterium ISCC 51]QXD29912.1 bifunctional metallophosphatase/5'-nucleotidase [Opitutae bacterium ISCC 52]
MNSRLLKVFLLGYLVCFGATLLAEKREVTLLFTNDFESAFDPIPAYWRDDIELIGGAPQIATLVNNIREEEELVFLFDSGDIFTGILSKLTEGAVPMEMMITMGYDAMAIGNHEFEYGWESFAEQKNRLPFPVLGANMFYADTGRRYAQPYTIVERDGFRIGVVGIMGQDAGTAIIPSHVAGVDVRDPIPVVQAWVDELRPQVDIVLALTHQGKTAPMQTDDEAHPEIHRGIEADYRMAGAVKGIDVLFGGHADAGTEEAVVHKKTGTLIMQTYGQGTRLGQLKLSFDTEFKEIVSHEGRLIPVVSNELEPHPVIVEKLAHYRAQFPELEETVFYAQERLSRAYNEESDLGNLYADILRDELEAEIGFINAGALRKDLPQGDVPLADLMDSFPFQDEVVVLEMTGAQIMDVLEQSLTLERGLLQLSGPKVRYHKQRSTANRVYTVEMEKYSLKLSQTYKVATIEILAQGGDLFSAFTEAKRLTPKGSQITFADMLKENLSRRQVVGLPVRGRMIPVLD